MSRIHLDVEQRCLRIDDYKYFYEWKEDYDSDYDELGELRCLKEDRRCECPES
jgi:hypothetical protein